MSLYYHVLFSPHSNLSGLSLVAVITEGGKKKDNFMPSVLGYIN